MMQCERCGASNQPHSRFCVSCGSPMLANPAPGTAQQPAQPAPPPQGSHQQSAPYHRPPVQQHYQPQQAQPQAPTGPTWNPPPQAQPSYPAPAYRQQSVPVAVQSGPPSSSLPFAETAAPPSREDLDRLQQARQAALAGYARSASGSMPAAYPASSAPPGPAGYGAPAQAYRAPSNPPAGYPQATAAMPGIAQDPMDVPEGAPRILCGFLVTYESDPMGTFWPIYQGRNVVGREGAPIPLDVRISHPTTSSRHAVIRASALPGRFKLEDFGSTNGTFVNDVRLSQGQPVELKDGDRVRFGLFGTIVKVVEGAVRSS